MDIDIKLLIVALMINIVLFIPLIILKFIYVISHSLWKLMIFVLATLYGASGHTSVSYRICEMILRSNYRDRGGLDD